MYCDNDVKPARLLPAFYPFKYSICVQSLKAVWNLISTTGKNLQKRHIHIHAHNAEIRLKIAHDRKMPASYAVLS